MSWGVLFPCVLAAVNWLSADRAQTVFKEATRSDGPVWIRLGSWSLVVACRSFAFVMIVLAIRG